MVEYYPPLKIPPSRGLKRQIVRPFNVDKDCVLALLPDINTKWLDQSDESNDGAITGATLKYNGRRGPCLYFDGTTNEVVVADHASINFASGDFSLAMWFKPGTDITTRQLLLGKKWDLYAGNPGYSLYIEASEIESRTADGTTQDLRATTIKASTWQHVVYTLTGNDHALYIDGVSKSTSTAAIGDIDNTRALHLGYMVSNKNPYTGYMDEALMFNRGLKPWEVKALYQMGKP